MDTVDVIIPIYKPKQSFLKVLERLHKQSLPVGKIILMNTGEVPAFLGAEACNRYPKIELHHCSEEEFDHGGTRNAGVSQSKADIFLLMTQDALPKDADLVKNLCAALETSTAAIAYARQLPQRGCNLAEAFGRSFNYPPQRIVKTKKDLPRMGVKTYFCSNVCAAYKKEIFETLGGFVSPTIFNEDMIYAASVIQAGHSIVYEPKAKVWHSHSYRLPTLFRRNFDLGVSQAQYPQVFADVPSESEGIRMIKCGIRYFMDNHHAECILPFLVSSACKFAGYQLGKHYKQLPQEMVSYCSAHKNYWKQSKQSQS